MAARASDVVSRLAVERARARMPDLAPDSVEVVELVRGAPYVVVRMAPAGILVLDEKGRLVRGRSRLAAIARHLDAVARVRQALDQALLDRRLAHVEQSVALLGEQRSRLRRQPLLQELAGLVDGLAVLGRCLGAVEGDRARKQGLPPTERTLRRTVVLLNRAARADRAVVIAARRLGAVLGDGGTERSSARALRRWVAARLASSDIPFFYAGLDERESERFVCEFIESARM